MKCSCPKCSALLPEDLSRIPEKGMSGKCSECGGSYWIHRESFILRCYAVEGERYCCSCGESLGPSTYCPGCGALYPDYCVVNNKKPAQRAFEKKNFSLPGFSGKSAAPGRKQNIRTAGGRAGSSDLRRQLLMVGGGIALLAVIAVVALLYLQDRAESKFIKEYVVALYSLKAGTDQCVLKSALLAGGSRLVEKDLDQLKFVDDKITSALQVLSPPDKFINVQDRLLKLSSTYKKLYHLCTTSGPSAEVILSAQTLESQFNAQAKELKGVLPSPLLAELIDKSSRYKNLQFMLE
jgi:hypothetical protein